MTMTVEKAQLNNQSILQDFALVEEIDEQAAEIISGGFERFLIRNRTRSPIGYAVDGQQSVIQTGEADRWITSQGGRITFDTDPARPGLQRKSYNLSDRKRYVFKPNSRTHNPNDIELYLSR